MTAEDDPFGPGLAREHSVKVTFLAHEGLMKTKEFEGPDP